MYKIKFKDGTEKEFTTLVGADLSGANLSEANLSRANLSWADLSGADLSRANLSRANLFWANLSGADLSWANLSRANLSGANLSEANLSGANLSRANLSGANLSEADLSEADLSRANLSGANLSRADLSGADLTDTKIPQRKGGLNILKEQEICVAFKYVDKNLFSPIKGSLQYIVGSTVKQESFDSDERNLCGEGLHVATLEWCLNNMYNSSRLLKVQFKGSDIVCIPLATDGKFRVKELKVLCEVDRYGKEIKESK